MLLRLGLHVGQTDEKELSRRVSEIIDAITSVHEAVTRGERPDGLDDQQIEEIRDMDPSALKIGFARNDDGELALHIS